LGNDKSYVHRITVADNPGGSGISSVLAYYSKENVSWSSAYSMNYVSEFSGLYTFEYNIPLLYLDALSNLYVYVIVFDNEGNNYTSEIIYENVFDTLPPTITNALLNPNEINYEDTPVVSANVTTIENPSSVEFSYTINDINPQTISMEYNNLTKRYEVTLPTYCYLSEINGEIRAYSSGGTLSTLPISYTVTDNIPPEITLLTSSLFIEGLSGEIQISAEDLNPNLLLGDEWVKAEHRLSGTANNYVSCSYTLFNDKYTFSIPSGYLEGEVIEVKVTATDNLYNEKIEYYYFTVLENDSPTIQTLNHPASAGYLLDFVIELTLTDQTGIDPSSVKIKHTYPDGSWTNLILMTDVGGGIFKTIISSSNHAGIYTINFLIEFKDTIGNRGTTCFNIQSIDNYAPSVPTLYNVPEYIDINTNPENNIDIIVSSTDDNPSGDYYCSNGEYRYNLASDYATEVLLDSWDFKEDVDGWADAGIYSGSKTAENGNLIITVDGGNRYYFGTYWYEFTAPIDMVNSDYKSFKLRAAVSELPGSGTPCKIAISVSSANDGENFWDYATTKGSSYIITQANTWYNIQITFDSFSSNTDASNIRKIRIQVTSQVSTDYFTPNTAKLKIESIKLLKTENWTEWNDLSYYDGIKMKCSISNIAPIYLGETLTFEVRMYDNYNNPSPIISDTLFIDDHVGPTISFGAPSSFSDNSDLTLTAIITTSGYSLCSSSVSFDFYKTDPNSRTYLPVSQNGNTFTVLIPNSMLMYGDTIHYRFIASDIRPDGENSCSKSSNVIIDIDETGPEVSSCTNDDSNNIIHFYQDLGINIIISDSQTLDWGEQAWWRIKGHYASVWSNWNEMEQSQLDASMFDDTISKYDTWWLEGGSAHLWYDIEIKVKDTLGNYATHVFENFFKVVDYNAPVSQSISHTGGSIIYNDESFYIYADFVDYQESYHPSMMNYLKLEKSEKSSSGSWGSWVEYSGTMEVVDSNTWRLLVGPFTTLGEGEVKFRVNGFDKAGYNTYSSELVISISTHDSTPPSVTDWWGDPSQPVANDYFTVKAYVSEPDSELTSVKVEYYVNSGSKTHYIKDMSYSATYGYWKKTSVPSGSALVKTYFRIIATSEGGTTTTGWHYVTSKSGFFLYGDEKQLLSWNLDTISREFSTSFNFIISGAEVTLWIRDGRVFVPHPLSVSESQVATGILDLKYKERIEFYVDVIRDEVSVYISPVTTYEIGDIYFPEIVQVIVNNDTRLFDNVEVKVLIKENNIKTAFLQFLETSSNGNLTVSKAIKMKFREGFYNAKFKAKHFPGYYLQIRVVDKSAHETVSSIYYLYTHLTEKRISMLIPISLGIILGISISVKLLGLKNMRKKVSFLCLNKIKFFKEE